MFGCEECVAYTLVGYKNEPSLYSEAVDESHCDKWKTAMDE